MTVKLKVFMSKVKILLSEEPTAYWEYPFCTNDGCVLTAYDSSYGESLGSLDIRECYGAVRDSAGYFMRFDFSKCPFCVALHKFKTDEVTD